MKIAYVCISHKPITYSSVGGIETFSVTLVRALQQQGCEVTMFASEESDATLFPGDFEPLFSLKDLDKQEHEDLESKSFTLNYALIQYAGLQRVLARVNEFDIVHVNCAQWYTPFVLAQANHSVVTTIHVNNLRVPMMQYLMDHFSVPYIVNISQITAKPFRSYVNRKTIYNGIDVADFEYSDTTHDYFAWLGRISPVKGLKEALLAARDADVPLHASGSVDFDDYFHEEVEPLLSTSRTYKGPLFGKEKSVFMGEARAMVLPVLWDEPFGLVAIEAMACGTPVIAYARGGLLETVKDGVTGFLIDPGDGTCEDPKRLKIQKSGIDGLVEAMRRIETIDRKACRQHVERYFSSQIMARNYFAYFQEIEKRRKS